MKLKGRLIHAWNAFKGNEAKTIRTDLGTSYSYNQSRSYRSYVYDNSIVTALMTRISMDISALEFVHCDVDDNNRYLTNRNSGLNHCLTVEANLDQSARAFKQDLAFRLLDKGVVAVVPVDTTINPDKTGGYDIKTLRVGEITEWFPKHVKVKLYNEQTGRKEEIVLSKSFVAIIENPLYPVMNEPNSTLQRLVRKIKLLDVIDDELAGGKFNLIFKLPYAVKNDTRRMEAEARRKRLEEQLRNDKFGIAYTDSTEEVIQLNRPIESNLLPTVEYLTKELYSHLGITSGILSGDANEQEMLNYYKRIVEPIASVIAEGLSRKFLTKTARAQHQNILYIRRAFDLVPMKDLAEIADKFTRNEILTSNEIRSITGFKPVSDPKADVLRNSNMPTKDTEIDNPEEQAYEIEASAMDDSLNSK